LKLFIEYEPNESGKGKFISRLIPELEEWGVKICGKQEKADIALSLTRFRSKFKGPRVLRVDGIHLISSNKTYWNNDRVKKCINKADAVIWQSNFCCDVAKKVLKVRPKREFQIYNGAPTDEFLVSKMDLGFKYNIFICGNFQSRKHKRLEDMLQISMEMDDPEIGWHVAGKIDIETPKSKRIKYLGVISREKIARYLASCDLMLDLQTASWCPNSVVEALVAGCPVIGCKGAGSEELIKTEGVLIYDEPPTRMRDNEKYYKINHGEVISAIRGLLKTNSYFERKDLHISNIAKQYYRAIEQVLNDFNLASKGDFL